MPLAKRDTADVLRRGFSAASASRDKIGVRVRSSARRAAQSARNQRPNASRFARLAGNPAARILRCALSTG